MNKINAMDTGGFAREVIPILNEEYPNDDNIFVIHKEYMPSEKTINGYSLISYEDFVKISSKEKTITIAISDSSIRSSNCQT